MPSQSQSQSHFKSNDSKNLFPPGFKYPLSLLNERCQKNGWEKPEVNTFPKGSGYAFSVTLRKSTNSKTASAPQIVRLQPHSPYIRQSQIEARHWAATYALYRVCNNIQLNRVLPPGPRDYWNELAAEHKKAEPHEQWKYDSDPFRAHKQLLERQAQAAVRKEKELKASNEPKVAREYLHAPEVKMGLQLRNRVEDVIKKNLKDSGGSRRTDTKAEIPAESIIKKHISLGFREQDIRDALDLLQRDIPFSKVLLEKGDADRGCLEILLLLVPECRLPKHFLDQKTSAPFISSIHRADEDAKLRRQRKIAVEQGGWPGSFVSSCLRQLENPELSDLMKILNNSLYVSRNLEELRPNDDDAKAAAAERATEISAIESIFEGTKLETEGSTQILKVHINASVRVQLSICFGSREMYPFGRTLPPMYIQSQEIPAFHRLYLLQRLLKLLNGKRIAGEPILLDAVQDLESEWEHMGGQPPNSSDVTALFQSSVNPTKEPEESCGTSHHEVSILSQRRQGGKRKIVDTRSSAQILSDFKDMQAKEQYRHFLQVRQHLPAAKCREELIRRLNESRVIIVIGETGSGKTTQVPQFVLDSLIESRDGARANIIVTQPRRLAAISIASRVSKERAQDGSVGYSIRGETNAGPKTKLLFCTTGIALRMLASENQLYEASHLVIDEVHERSVEIDLLLLEARELLKRSRNLKLILMSATIDTSSFTNYFNGAPVFAIPGRTFPVENFYLEDIVSKLTYKCPPQVRLKLKWSADKRKNFTANLKTKKIPEQHFQTLETISRSEEVDFQLISVLVSSIIESRTNPCAILIFLSGTQEIRRCIEAMKSSGLLAKAEIFQLHANMPSQDQEPIFRKYDRYKIIASTNVAETSITIDDVAVVIDTGKVKITDYDPQSGLVNLKEEWITFAAAKQRCGRAGRSRAGQCYRMYTEYEMGLMKTYLKPEILRMPLENVVLSSKVVSRNEEVTAYLAKALDPPAPDTICKAIYLLQELRALDETQSLTSLGQHLAHLPLDVRLAKVKMLVLGVTFQCLDPILTIVSNLSCKSLMVENPGNRDEITRFRRSYSKSYSDLLADCRIYQDCMRHKRDSKASFDTFCAKNNISVNNLRDIGILREDLFQTFSEIALIPNNITSNNTCLNINSENDTLIKAVIMSGLWPRVARIHLPKRKIKYDQVQAGTVRRENEAREYQLFDIGDCNMRVFTHPGSVMFSEISGKSSFLMYFNKHQATKVYLRDATEVPNYAILLFGGPLQINHVGGGITVGGKDNPVHLRAWPRIGVLVNQLRVLLHEQLNDAINTACLMTTRNNPVIEVVLALLATDGVSH